MVIVLLGRIVASRPSSARAQQQLYYSHRPSNISDSVLRPTVRVYILRDTVRQMCYTNSGMLTGAGNSRERP